MLVTAVALSRRALPRRAPRLSRHLSTTDVRKGFGSFHSEDVEVLVRQPESTYVPPAIYSAIQEQAGDDAFAAEARRHRGDQQYARTQLFPLDEDWTFVNHGAFGLATNQLLNESNLWRYYCELQPLRFFDRELMPLIAMSVREMAKHLSCPPQELMPLQNVTTGLNSILNSTRLAKSDEILCYSLTYGSTKKMMADLASRSGAVLRTVHLPLSQPLTKEFILSQTTNALSSRTKLVVIDAVTSNTAVAMPVLELAALCRAAGATVVVDAAHSLFAQEVTLYNRGANGYLSSQGCISEHADYWLTNAHKWMCNPKGCAFMWVNPRVSCLRPAIVSHGFVADGEGLYTAPGKLLSSFAWDGCRDYSSLLTVSSAIRQWGYLDAPACRKYNADLLRAAVEVLRSAWGIAADDCVAEASLQSGSPMALVPLPAKVSGRCTLSDTSDDDAFRLQERLHHEHLIEAPVKCLEGRLYVRISAHVYNRIEDYHKLASAVKEMQT